MLQNLENQTGLYNSILFTDCGGRKWKLYIYIL